ncbi:IQ domain-containing protein/DUF4005 domain-containing protein [Cephalotus follicularis]|uniref:IQ domain-containing protein/DUF4005 domain-containing protein n=1 Tax=Cephalotus follicularis TaxID=3775 RepID=A0A1Q3C7Y2_CEPFO|nr:IQ domain-containing protein/DUF4005 domain-containing protein [Cephalotus follicularis]
MAKKKSLLNLLSRFFTSEIHSKPEKEKRRKWIFGRLKIKRLGSIAAPAPSKDRILNEAKEEQSKHALTMAAATAAAQAAVTAAQVAAEVVLPTSIPQSIHERESEKEKLAVQSYLRYQMQVHELAAIKIQTIFRGFLARKALRALKGIVWLQAIIRGRLVRRQAITTLKCLQSIVNIQSQVCARRIQTAGGTWHGYENNQLQTLKDKIIKMDTNSQRRWDDSILTKEEEDAMFLNKRQAMIKRERTKEYWFSHRKSAESEQNKVNERWRYWREQWVDTQLSKSKELEDLDTVLTSTNQRPKEGYRIKELKLKTQQRYHNVEGLGSPISVSRKTFHHKSQFSLGNDNSFSSSAIVPAYMAATESAKAKSISSSSPKMRTGCFDTYSDGYSPCKNRLSLISSVASEVPISRPSTYQQRSPSLKGIPGPPIKSCRTFKNLSLDSGCSFSTWDGQSAFR